jgi:lantibiotic modifying enzyme
MNNTAISQLPDVRTSVANIEKKIHHIYEWVNKKDNVFYVHHPALVGGEGGILLFKAYYYNYFKIQIPNSFEDDLKQLISQSDHFDSYNLGNGYLGLAWLISHLYGMKVLSKDYLLVLNEINDYLEEVIDHYRSMRNYDLLYGLGGVAMYLIENPDIKNRSKLLQTVTDTIVQLASIDGDVVFWQNYFSITRNRPDEIAVDFGLAHGMSSILIILCRLIQEGARVDHSLLTKATNWLLSQKRQDQEFGIFPHFYIDGDDKGESRLAWCYGDLCIAISVHNVAKILQDKRLFQEAYRIAKDTLNRSILESGIPFDNNGFVECSVCHGSPSLILIYNHLYLETGDTKFMKASNSFCHFLLTGIDNSRPLAGFVKTLHDDETGYTFSEGHFDILNGIAGTGLTLLSKLDPSFKWQKLFLIDHT